jgi:hypothetical protein
MLWRRREPQAQTEVEPGRFFRFWRWTKRVAAALAIALAIGVLAAPTATNRLLEKERERIRAAGEPLTCADLVRMQTLPPGTPNAADVYQQAFDALDWTPEEEELAGHWSAQELPPDWVESMRPVVESNEQYFALLERAADIEACVFPVDWEKRADAEEPHLAHLRSAARMLTARALILAADGRAEEALQGCGPIPAMMQHLSQEPTVVGQLVRYALISIGIRGVEQLLSQCDPSAQACRELCDAFGEVELSESFREAAKGERAWAREVAFDVVREGLPRSANWGVRLAEARLNIDEWLYLRAMREQMQASALPWPEAKYRARAAAERAESMPWPICVTTTMMLPYLDRVAESCRLTTGRLDVCQIGLALRAYQAEHGRYPDSLEELAADGWEVPRDSFTDEPYRYRREGDGFIVWGAGMDLDDDGGKPFKPSSSRTAGEADSEKESEAKRDYDIVFRCSR